MFCIYCGKQINEGETCSCQAPQPAYNPYVAPVTATPTYATTPSAPSLNGSSSLSALHRVLGGTMMKIVAILLTVGLAVRVISGFFDIAFLLTVIGTWIVYANSKAPNGPNSTRGYGMLAGVSILNAILYILATPLLIMLIWYFLPHLNEFISYFTPGYKVILTDLSEIILVVLTIAVYVWGLVYHVFNIITYFHLKKAASGVPVKLHINGLYNVLLFLHGLFFIGLCICIFLSFSNITAELPELITEFFYENSGWAREYEDHTMKGVALLTPMVLVLFPVSFLISGVGRILSSIMFARLNKKN